MTWRRSLRIAFTILAVALTTAPARALTVVLITDSNGSLTSEETERKNQFQSWGYTVTTLWDGSSQSSYDAALASADLAYVSEEASATDTAYKLRFATIGVVYEEYRLDDEFGISTSDGATTNQTQINLVDPAYGSGLIAIFSSTRQETYLQGTIATGFRSVGETPGGQKSLGLIVRGSPLANTYNGNSTAARRRLRLPWGGSSFAFSSLNSTGLALLQNGLAWAADAG